MPECASPGKESFLGRVLVRGEAGAWLVPSHASLSSLFPGMELDTEMKGRRQHRKQELPTHRTFLSVALSSGPPSMALRWPEDLLNSCAGPDSPCSTVGKNTWQIWILS